MAGEEKRDEEEERRKMKERKECLLITDILINGDH